MSLIRRSSLEFQAGFCLDAQRKNADRVGAASPSNPDKEKHSRRNQSASARTWIHVIWTLPEGAELLMAALSAAPSSSQPIQLLLLIAFFSSSPSPHPSFRRGRQLTNVFSEVPSVLDPYLPQPPLVFAFPCERMNKQWRVALCVCGGKKVREPTPDWFPGDSRDAGAVRGGRR